MIVRAVGLDDVLAVAEFQTRTWAECYAGLVPQAYLDARGVPERCARWARSVRTGERGCALAEVDGVVVGAVSWVPGELKSLYVAAGHRGSGVADRLLEHAIGTSGSTLWVFRDNARARRFYARHRFSVVDGSERVDAGTGVPEVQMSRP